MYAISTHLWCISIQLCIFKLISRNLKLGLSKTIGQQLFQEMKESATCLGIYTTSTFRD